MSTDKKIFRKVRLLKLPTCWGDVSQACKIMEYSRDCFCRWLSRATG
jgi:hypothetical protein